MINYTTWHVFLFVCWLWVSSNGSTSIGNTKKIETSCCPWLMEPIPRYAILEITSNLTECGPELIFHLLSGHTICVPAKGWAKKLACFMKSEKDAENSLFWVVKEAARMLTKNYRGENTFEYHEIDLDMDDFMYAVTDIQRRPKTYIRSYEYKAWDGASWIKCQCELKLHMNSKFFPDGIGAGKSKASISYTLDVTFSATNGDLFTRCTHNHLYAQDVLSRLPIPNGYSLLSGQR
ncbi:pr131 [rat cytomegalovirus strain Maastricht]|uniref:Pr131 n=1 Tax=Rat cytomegalovirus (strain Maastricht) TaxID=79700 RepID=Q9DW62_RCMVM|nr:pr131 [rat cytomegalovirus strain Maastricht]AAF99228.1 pr131 [rat cytomegalovirus strain Maastricht]WEG72047.1 protein m131 [Murid betaherpesvirus 2]